MELGLLLRDADLPCACRLRAAAYRTLGATKQGREHQPAHAGSEYPATRLGGALGAVAMRQPQFICRTEGAANELHCAPPRATSLLRQQKLHVQTKTDCRRCRWQMRRSVFVSDNRSGSLILPVDQITIHVLDIYFIFFFFVRYVFFNPFKLFLFHVFVWGYDDTTYNKYGY